MRKKKKVSLGFKKLDAEIVALKVEIERRDADFQIASAEEALRRKI